MLPKGTVETLLKPENKEMLSSILTYHIVAGNVGAAQLLELLKAGHGKAKLTNVSAGKLTASVKGKNVVITDGKVGMPAVTTKEM